MAASFGLGYSHTVGFMSLMGDRGFANPVDMAIGKDGLLYVLSRGGSENDDYLVSKRVTVCTLDGKFIGDFGGGGTGDGQLVWPSSIAMDGDENVYVSDEALHRISVFSKEGRFLEKWGAQGSGEGQFDRPAAMAFDAEGQLLVVDGLNNRVQRYDKGGRFLGQWGEAGSGDGQFNVPWGIALDVDGNVYVADWRNDRVQKFDGGGGFLAAWGRTGSGDGEFNRPSGVAVDGDGKVYVADWGNERMQVLSPEGGFVLKVRGDSGLSTWAYEYFTTNEDELEEREKADLEPELELAPEDYLRDESASIEKLFWGPTAVKVDGEGRVYVVDTNRARVQVYVRAPVGSAGARA